MEFQGFPCNLQKGLKGYNTMIFSHEDDFILSTGLHHLFLFCQSSSNKVFSKLEFQGFSLVRGQGVQKGKGPQYFHVNTSLSPSILSTGLHHHFYFVKTAAIKSLQNKIFNGFLLLFILGLFLREVEPIFDVSRRLHHLFYFAKASAISKLFQNENFNVSNCHDHILSLSIICFRFLYKHKTVPIWPKMEKSPSEIRVSNH